MQITTDMIKELRGATNVPFVDCRKALEESGGDFKKAVDWLREKGMATAAKRADRQVSNGMVELYAHGGGRVGVMVEVNCETDFVARSEQFRKLAHEIALQIAASAPRYIRAEDVPASELEHEADIARARAKEEGKPANVLDKIVEGRVEKFKDEVCLTPIAGRRSKPGCSALSPMRVMTNCAGSAARWLLWRRWTWSPKGRRLLPKRHWLRMKNPRQIMRSAGSWPRPFKAA